MHEAEAVEAFLRDLEEAFYDEEDGDEEVIPYKTQAQSPKEPMLKRAKIAEHEALSAKPSAIGDNTKLSSPILRFTPPAGSPTRLLAADLLLNCFAFLEDASEYAKLRSISRTWYRFAEDESLWKILGSSLLSPKTKAEPAEIVSPLKDVGIVAEQKVSPS